MNADFCRRCWGLGMKAWNPRSVRMLKAIAINIGWHLPFYRLSATWPLLYKPCRCPDGVPAGRVPVIYHPLETWTEVEAWLRTHE